MHLKCKKLIPEAQLPVQPKSGDAGLDLFISSLVIEGNLLVIHTGIAVEIPEGYVGLLFPRSSMSKQPLIMANSVGVIDSNYRGEIIAKFRRNMERGFTSADHTLQVGDRAVQLVIVPCPEIEIIETDELSSTQRGTGGFGTSGK